MNKGNTVEVMPEIPNQPDAESKKEKKKSTTEKAPAAKEEKAPAAKKEKAPVKKKAAKKESAV